MCQLCIRWDVTQDHQAIKCLERGWRTRRGGQTAGEVWGTLPCEHWTWCDWVRLMTYLAIPWLRGRGCNYCDNLDSGGPGLVMDGWSLTSPPISQMRTSSEPGAWCLQIHHHAITSWLRDRSWPSESDKRTQYLTRVLQNNTRQWPRHGSHCCYVMVMICADPPDRDTYFPSDERW